MSLEQTRDIEGLCRERTSANYLLNEVSAYLMKNTPTHKPGIEFFDWFMRQYKNHREGF